MGHYCKVIKRILKKIFQYFFPAVSKEKKFQTSRFVLLVLWLLKRKEYTGEVLLKTKLLLCQFLI